MSLMMYTNIQFIVLHQYTLHCVTLIYSSLCYTNTQFTVLHRHTVHCVTPIYSSLCYTNIQFIVLHRYTVHCVTPIYSSHHISSKMAHTATTCRWWCTTNQLVSRHVFYRFINSTFKHNAVGLLKKWSMYWHSPCNVCMAVHTFWNTLNACKYRYTCECRVDSSQHRHCCNWNNYQPSHSIYLALTDKHTNKQTNTETNMNYVLLLQLQLIQTDKEWQLSSDNVSVQLQFPRLIQVTNAIKHSFLRY
jgi:hypothetical protein